MSLALMFWSPFLLVLAAILLGIRKGGVGVSTLVGYGLSRLYY